MSINPIKTVRKETLLLLAEHVGRRLAEQKQAPPVIVRVPITSVTPAGDGLEIHATPFRLDMELGGPVLVKFEANGDAVFEHGETLPLSGRLAFDGSLRMGLTTV